MDKTGGCRSATGSGRSRSDGADPHAASGATEISVGISGARTNAGSAGVDLSSGPRRQIVRGAPRQRQLRKERHSLPGIPRAPAKSTTLERRYQGRCCSRTAAQSGSATRADCRDGRGWPAGSLAFWDEPAGKRLSLPPRRIASMGADDEVGHHRGHSEPMRPRPGAAFGRVGAPCVFIGRWPARRSSVPRSVQPLDEAWQQPATDQAGTTSTDRSWCAGRRRPSGSCGARSRPAGTGRNCRRRRRPRIRLIPADTIGALLRRRHSSSGLMTGRTRSGPPLPISGRNSFSPTATDTLPRA